MADAVTWQTILAILASAVSGAVGGVIGAWSALRAGRQAEGSAQRREQAERDWQDRQRTFQDRKQACLDFYGDYVRTLDSLQAAAAGGPMSDLHTEIPAQLGQRLGVIDLYVSTETSELAGEAIGALWELSVDVLNMRAGANRDDARVKALEAEYQKSSDRAGDYHVKLQDAIRAELGVPPFEANTQLPA